jgi:hypothetical protein
MSGDNHRIPSWHLLGEIIAVWLQSPSHLKSFTFVSHANVLSCYHCSLAMDYDVVCRLDSLHRPLQNCSVKLAGATERPRAIGYLLQSSHLLLKTNMIQLSQFIPHKYADFAGMRGLACRV